ncbi:lipoyl synthase [Ilumatobacter coccineus]|uniref:Multifunctional fusion protein n=1 Tax=Ilumatobacter coccineus (strain NBRC 103263 / KCTC 29153 / YM16-304) TaxID=1313172 RepID=A0A6C7EF80_ILUCY|nr:lipoyl synthase [Ilumatobacter coccineus]BAN03278.1 octanoyltransferase/lipoyl synthase [Ilumatobacter coccineus YM16-304]
MSDPLRVRWLGTVPYREALAVQESLFAHGTGQHLLLLEHPHVFTYGRTADLATNLKCEPAAVGAELVPVKRGGDITYHGPGQLVGYPILNVENSMGASDHVCGVEGLIIDALAELGLPHAGRLAGYAGVWLDAGTPAERKICAIGVRLRRGRTMHGFGLNVTTDLNYMREHIVPCGIGDKPVTSLAEEGIAVSVRDVADVISRLAAERWGGGAVERQDVAWAHAADGRDLSAFSRGEGPGEQVKLVSSRATARMEAAGVTDGLSIETRKPDWLRPKVELGPEVMDLKKTIRSLDLVTVCEDAGCPNLSDCWSDGTATFMVLGERCTRACGFCLVDTSKPLAPAADEPQRVAEAIDRMALDHAVLTMVARDDLADGGMAHVAACVEAIRLRRPQARIETLISDAKGDDSSLDLLFASRPDVMNHNVETVARLQRAVRPSAGYARSLGVLARAKAAGLTTKTGFMAGLGETDDEIVGLLADLADLGVDIVTIGQYLRPTSHHLPIARYAEPAEFERWKQIGEAFGIGHVEASPLTRSSYHAKSSADAVVEPVPVSLSR